MEQLFDLDVQVNTSKSVSHETNVWSATCFCSVFRICDTDEM